MVKFSFHSIKTQILVAFSLLVLPLVGFTYFFSLSHQLFDNALDEIIKAEAISDLLSEVERDVVDLQRNVFIFKETASKNAVNKVNGFYAAVDGRLKNLKTISTAENLSETIVRMQGHLSEFKQNFDVVVGLRNQRSELINKHLESQIFFEIENYALSNRNANSLLKVKNDLLFAHTASLSYLESYDHAYIDSYKKRIILTQNGLDKLVNNHEFVGGFSSDLNLYEKNFLRLVSISRHYVYLINVVMTGSANEILFHAKTLDDAFLTDSNLRRSETSKSMARQNAWSNFLSALGILMAGLVSVLFYWRITTPIERITKVFFELSEGNKVGLIPERHRRDEIGMLASSADVFKSKNEQTNRLLVETERMVREQKMLNEELSIQKIRAEKALSIKTEFLANMSHELRTPLNSIIGFTVRLIKHSDGSAPRHIQALHAIERNGRHLLAMINDVLDLSKIEANKLELKVSAVNLSDLCGECVGQISTAAEEKGLEIGFDPVANAYVKTDPVRMQQILLNLLSNAIKYTDSGSVKVELEPGYGDLNFAIKVSDTGRGITTEDQEKLFRRFEQFEDSTRFEVGQGTGLGLSIVASLSRLLGAAVTVRSEYGKGSCFTIRIPARFSNVDQLEYSGIQLD